jgi:O-antigen/teichoic acid export membrane protein
MKIGQTSFAVFVSKLVGSALGFVATLYFARELGASVLGSYALVLALVAWLKLGGRLGISSAMTKRMSEGEEPAAYATAAAVTVAGLGLVLTLLVFAFDNTVQSYVGVDVVASHVGVGVAALVAILLLVGLFESFVGSALTGERKVHVAGALTPLGVGIRSIVQIGLVTAGFGLVGMLTGYAVGGLLVGAAGATALSVRPVRPQRRHFEQLYEYAKFSWLGSLKSRSFNDVDILLLGVFVQPSLVGVYSAAWSVANFLTLFDSAVSSTLFPELSRLDAEGENKSVAGLVEDSLTYGGLLLLPGFVGGGLLGDRLLRIYGPEFVEGVSVLWILILATLLYAYQKQFLNALNGIDRPDAAFRINAIFIATNVVLNVVLISTIGVVGAAVATALSAAVGLTAAFRNLRSAIEFSIPFGEIVRQVLAAVAMGVVVYGTELLVEGVVGLNHNFITVLVLVAVGAAAYFSTLFSLSSTFRATVRENNPLA